MEPGSKKKNSAITNYVIDNIDVAIKKGWIKVYYQPVIRTLTEQLCGAESLARWIDPEIGFLAPDQFIGALEESGQISKLDCYIVETVCRDISERMAKDFPTVPVSINFSRLDFETTDMLEVVKDAVDKYDIPRDAIHIEITESMIASDAELMQKVIEDFRGAGYEVWMDDFGSGYSSLNLLKDYQFDTVKLDMAFLRNFTERSQAIITSTVTMAKDIGIKTLAEGVEDREQVEFLKSIGCGRLQGYFYGKPMPLEEFFDHIKERGIGIEERQWRHYYDVASFHARHTDEPLEIIEDDGKEFTTLFMNAPYKRQIFPRGITTEDANRLIYNTASPLLKKYREFADTLERTRNTETFYYTNNGDILKFTAIVIASNAGRFLIKGSIWNISSDDNITKRNSLDFRLKELNHLFEMVLQINTKNNKVTPLLGGFHHGMGGVNYSTELDARLKWFCEEMVSPEDKAKFMAFINFDTLNERITSSKKGYVENIFRVKQGDGSYKWKEISVMLIPGTRGKEYLYCIKATSDDAGNFVKGLEELKGNKEENGEGTSISNDHLFSSFINFAPIMFFWKDKERRYLGASNEFLKYFHISKLEDILGRTGDECNWDVDSESYTNNELEVLQKGKSIHFAPAKCIIEGVVHNIMFYKGPIYENGEIVGLMGFIVDADIEAVKVDDYMGASKIDEMTGLMNVKGFVNTTVDYALQYKKNGRNYGMIVLRNEKHERITETYGTDFANKVIKKIGEVIISETSYNCAAGRLNEAEFAVLLYLNDNTELKYIAENLKKKIESIYDLEGNSVTIKVEVGYALRSEVEGSEENMYQFVLNKLK